MDEQQHSLDEIFRRSLGDYREAPPAAAWEKVVAKLDEDEKNRRKVFFWPWPWIVLLSLLTVGGGLYLAARYQDRTPKQEKSGEFITASSSDEQLGSTSDPAADISTNQSDPLAEAGYTTTNGVTTRTSSNNPQRTDKVPKESTTTSAGKSTEARHSKTGQLNASDYSNKNSNGHSSKNSVDQSRASVDDENVNRSKSSQSNVTTSNRDVAMENDPVQTDHTATRNSSTQKKSGAAKAGNGSISNVKVAQGSDPETLAATPVATETGKTKTRGGKSSDLAVASSSRAGSPADPATPATRTSAADKPLKVKSPSKNQTPKTSSTSINETANSASGKTGSKSTRKAVPTETQASPDAASTTAAKPSADATSAASSSAKAGSMTAPALAKAGPEKIPTQRKPGTSMAATSPSFEESKAKDELALPEPQAAPKAESAAVKDSSKTARTDETSEPEKDSKGGEGGSSGDEKARQKPSFSLALHGGYEFAMQNPAPNQFSAGFRLLWHFDPGISIGIQPGIRYGNMSTISNASQAYQQTTTVTVDSLVTLDSAGKVSGRTYIPEQTFDSIVVAGLSAGGPIWQFEIPIILNYKFGRGWFAYGGPSINLGGKIDHSAGDIKTYSIHRIDTVYSQPGSVQPSQPPTAFANYFGTSSLPQYSTYQPATNEWKDPMNLRFGYLIGLGYEHKRLFFDVSLRQQISGFTEVPDPYKKVYSSPYVRIGVGWKIIPEKTKK